jgi:serine/threonine protein phosphatase 1
MFWKTRVLRKPQMQKHNARIAEGQRIYAIGDIHGRLDLFDALLRQIDDDNGSRPPSDVHLILLGDLVDRGPDSAGVVARALELAQGTPKTHFLLGNHEEIFLKVMEGDAKAVTLFHRIGGRETALSYGISEQAYHDSDPANLTRLLQDHVPQSHVAFLSGFEDLIVFGDYAFVHAGVRPGVALSHQRTRDLRWIRSEFLQHDGPFEKIVVHGHTISDKIEQTPHRIGVDTGAYTSGILSAVGFEGTERWVLQADDKAQPWLEQVRR